MWGEGALGELASAPVHPRLTDQVNALAFDPAEEALWAGTESGLVCQLVSPGLEPYSAFPAHQDRVIELRTLGEAAVSISCCDLSVHGSGGLQRLSWSHEAGDLAALGLEPRSTRVVLGRSSGGLLLFDLKLGKPVGTADTSGRGVVALCGPTGRGSLVMGTTDGCICLLDPRSGYKAETSLQAHPGGFAALDARGELVASCGYVSRMGRLTLDTYAKVFDVRMGARMLASVPFAPGPAMLHFHPRFSSTLLLASSSGAFTLADAQGMSGGGMYQIETEGDMLVSAALSSSGECLAFGGSGGYIHLWAPSADPAVNQMQQVLTVPEPPTPLVSLSEDDPLSLAPTYFPAEANGLLSDLGPFDGMAVGLPPRVVDASLLKGMKQSDFVGYIQNPHVQRGAPFGAATRAAAPQRNARVQPRPDSQELEAARAERARKRAAAGGVVLPGRYKRVHIKQQQGVRFEEFDFSYYNRTPFTGLENDLANCYTNALLQVLFFTPAMRDALLQHVPDAAAEFCLTDEMSFLFRMLATAAQGTVCQAANLLRALRQNKEAAGLGLLEGVKGERGATDIEVEAKKERSLSKRVQSLSRFLLEALNKEGSAGARQSMVEAVYGLLQRQRMQCLSRPNRPDQVKESRVFQVDLLYPPAKDRPAGAAGTIRSGTASVPGSAPTSPDAKSVASSAAAAAAASAAAGAAAGGAGRPAFADLLQQSLKVQSEMRAWFDEEVKYQYVRQTRVPKTLPQVLVVNCGLQDKEDLCWWQPVPYAAVDLEGEPVTRQRAWMPHAIAVTSDPEGWTVAVQEASSAEDLLAASCGVAAGAVAAMESVPPGGSRAVYELTAVVVLIRDEDDAEEAAESGQEYEGHLVAHIKVPPTYFEAQQQSPAAGTPHALSRSGSGTDTQAAGGSASGGGGGAGGGASGSGPTTPRMPAVPAVSPHAIASMLLPGAGAAAAAAAAAASPRQQPSPQQQATQQQQSPQQQSPQQSAQQQQQQSPQQQAAQADPGQQQLSGTEAEAIQKASDTLAATLSTPRSVHSTPPFNRHPQRYNWMVFNDFHITASLPEEVGELYGGQKLPCLLYYTQVEAVRRAAELPPLPPRPVLNPEGFLALCRMPPLQGPKVRLHKPTFAPLLPTELPQPGALFALDAEFVAYSPPEKALLRGVEVEVRPSRLGLARVSLLRGQGSSKGTPCIDDYIKSAEPVYDYLTKFSGLVPGDLDPARSPHYLTTLKRAYLKLRYLVDAGAVFVGHGLKKDFRMINIVVPPSQIVDTVDLFHAKRSRKLSLRFLASYLLRSSIQEHTHDSIEDAATALKLYDVYQQLVREGAFEAKLQEMYDWGKRFGWDPVIWKDGQPHPAPQQPPAGAYAAGASGSGGAGGPAAMGAAAAGPGAAQAAAARGGVGMGMGGPGAHPHMQQHNPHGYHHHHQHQHQHQAQQRGMHGRGRGFGRR